MSLNSHLCQSYSSHSFIFMRMYAFCRAMLQLLSTVPTNEVASAYLASVALSDVETPPSFMPRNEQHTFWRSKARTLCFQRSTFEAYPTTWYLVYHLRDSRRVQILKLLKHIPQRTSLTDKWTPHTMAGLVDKLTASGGTENAGETHSAAQPSHRVADA